MLDSVIENCRATFEQPAEIEMYSYFEVLTDQLKLKYPETIIPSVRIVYSINKLCETFNYKGVKYIIYDQYLGQTFNKFNRILYHEGDAEAKAYLCKLLSEEFYLNNQIEHCISHFLYYSLHSTGKIKNLPYDFIVKKTDLIMVQESFVLLHEIAHSMILIQPQLITKAQSFIETNNEAIFAMEGFDKFSEKSNENNILHFYEEFACDIFAIDELIILFSKVVDLELIMDGVELAFLYLRTLINLKQIATGNFRSNSGNQYRYFALIRFNLMRAYLHHTFADMLPKDKFYDAVAIYEKWEDNLDMNVYMFLTDELKISLFNIVNRQKELLTQNEAEELLKLKK